MEKVIDRTGTAAEDVRRSGPIDFRTMIEQSKLVADELAGRPSLGLNTFPEWELSRFAEIGLLSAPLPSAMGGRGLGIEPGTHTSLLRFLAILGGADLALGRLFEGHFNGIMLLHVFGTTRQMERMAKDIDAGMLSGVWNTGGSSPLKLHPSEDGFRFDGVKTFATGAAHVKRPIVTAEMMEGDDPRGWQMAMPRMELITPSLDRSFWHPLGMESSESFQIDFTRSQISSDDLVGRPGDFYRDPLFYGGTIRFAAVQTGAILRLHRMFAAWLDERGRTDDPYQAARLGEVAIAAQAGVLWLEKAGAVADECYYSTTKADIERMHECADMTRSAILQLATKVIQLVTEGVGAHGLLQPFRFERVLRDLTMYLRQPAPDYVVATIGRFSQDKLHRRSSGTEWGFWSDEPIVESLPSDYFAHIYNRQADPWNFQTSEYERAKYDVTLASLPLAHYDRALEIGCSIGVLTARLATRASHVLGIDVSDRALQQARERCAAMPQITFEKLQVPQQMPSGSFDLIVVSEVAYYWQRTDLETAADRIALRHHIGGHLVLVHLVERVRDYPLTGDEVHDYWTKERPEWVTVHSDRSARYRLEVLKRVAV